MKRIIALMLAALLAVALLASCGSSKKYIVLDDNFGAEEYAIGFRKGSELTAKVNGALEELAADGTIAELAEKYGVSTTVITDFSDQK